MLEPEDANSPTWPLTLQGYDATKLLRCKAAGENQFGNFPADELCMGDGQAPIAVQNQADEQFMKDFVSASNREPKAMRWLDGIMG